MEYSFECNQLALHLFLLPTTEGDILDMPTNRLSTLHGYVRMSWAPENLYNLARMSFGQAADMHERIAPIMRLKKSSMTMFQQKWVCKRLLRAYHGDWIPERSFRRRFLPDALPPLQANADSSSTLDKGKGRETAGADASKIPLGSLMWREVEARLDTLVFRACLAHSIYEARRLVTQGHVKLNGQLVRCFVCRSYTLNANTCRFSNEIQICS